MKLCDYGCGREAKFPFKNGKWCCSENWNSCPIQRKKTGEAQKGKKIGPFSEEHKKKLSKAKIGKKTGPRSEKTKQKQSNSMKGKNTRPLSEEHKRKISKALKGKKLGPMSEETKIKLSNINKGKTLSIEHKKKMSKIRKGKKLGPFSKEHKKNISESKKSTLKDYKEKYPFFFKVEELRETKNGEIQGHCKNHKCENSKEKSGWFTLTKSQLSYRIQAIERPIGFGESNFYCSQHCKDTCPLFGLYGDPYKDNNLPYTPGEIQVYNKIVLERENGLCEYCGEPAEHVHHIYPKKLEPFFALDPDYGVACCAKHHYKYAHQDECSTGNLAKITCSVESQKFLNQTLEDI
jgi:hypothetical protein